MIPPLTPGGVGLPVGRFPCDVAEIEAAFVDAFPGSTRRPLVWEHWLTATELLRSHVGVRYAWLGGSFLTDKPEPDDLDVVYWAEDVDLDAAQANPVSAGVIETFARSGLKAHGYQLDTFVVAWRSNPEAFARGPLDVAYYRSRGYWDDLWVRLRSGPKGAPRVRLDSIPRRGYLEVTLDGFPEQ